VLGRSPPPPTGSPRLGACKPGAAPQFLDSAGFPSPPRSRLGRAGRICAAGRDVDLGFCLPARRPRRDSLGPTSAVRVGAMPRRRQGRAMPDVRAAPSRLVPPDIGLDPHDRFFPTQDTLRLGGFGNLTALPLQKQARERGHTVSVDDDLVPRSPTNGPSCRRYAGSQLQPHVASAGVDIRRGVRGRGGVPEPGLFMKPQWSARRASTQARFSDLRSGLARARP
jgi:hypothetical protein